MENEKPRATESVETREKVYRALCEAFDAVNTARLACVGEPGFASYEMRLANILPELSDMKRWT